jgi:pyrimidine-nucleoside phosphorylase
LYALRDVTATVPSIPLIASSIMSKKLAAGAQGIVLDVKVGSGAFMHSLDEARELAQTMVAIGEEAGRDMIALISDMDQPLGFAVGNALEVREAIQTLHGHGPEDFTEHCLEVAAYMLQLAGRGNRWTDHDETRIDLVALLENDSAFSKFRSMVEAQGGDVDMVDNPEKLPGAKITEVVTAPSNGYVARMDALEVAKAAFALGDGREKKGDSIDLAVGVVVHCKVGDAVQAGNPVATIHANDLAKVGDAALHLERALELSIDPVEPLPLFYDVFEGD